MVDLSSLLCNVVIPRGYLPGISERQDLCQKRWAWAAAAPASSGTSGMSQDSIQIVLHLGSAAAGRDKLWCPHAPNCALEFNKTKLS